MRANHSTLGSDQRAHPRSPATRKVYLVDGPRAWKCSLIDIAEGGARISAANMDISQDGLFLVDSRARQVHATRVVWRSTHEAGLQFTQSDEIDGPAGGVAGALEIATRFAWRLGAR